MAKKERNRRSARQARQKEREEREASRLAADPKVEKKAQKAAAKAAKAEAKKDKKPGRVKSYLSAVNSEMHRVVWPSDSELKDYSFGVIGMLIVFGIAIWLVDNAVVLMLTGFAGLRG